jgi:hypothetical protein
LTTDDFAIGLLAVCLVVAIIGTVLIRIAIRRRDAENDEFNAQWHEYNEREP